MVHINVTLEIETEIYLDVGFPAVSKIAVWYFPVKEYAFGRVNHCSNMLSVGLQLLCHLLLLYIYHHSHHCSGCIRFCI